VKVLGLAVVLVVTGVAGTPEPATAPESASVELAFAAHSSRASVSLGGAAAPGQVVIDDAYLSLRDVRLRQASRCQEPGGARALAGPIVAELLSGRGDGIEEPFTVRPDRYCRLEYTPRRAEGASAPAPADLRGHTVLVRGRRDDGVRFVIRSRKREVVQLLARAPEGFAIAAGRQRLVISIDLGRWLEGIDLAPLVPGRGKKGVVRIDESSHRDLLRVFEGNLLAAITLCRGDAGAAGSARECPAGQRLAGGSR
jgi:hypothetical protein